MRLASCVLRLACARCVRACIFFVPLKAARSGHFSRREPRATTTRFPHAPRAPHARTHARTHAPHARRNYFVDGPLLRVHSRSLSYFFSKRRQKRRNEHSHKAQERAKVRTRTSLFHCVRRLCASFVPTPPFGFLLALSLSLLLSLSLPPSLSLSLSLRFHLRFVSFAFRSRFVPSSVQKKRA